MLYLFVSGPCVNPYVIKLQLNSIFVFKSSELDKLSGRTWNEGMSPSSFIKDFIELDSDENRTKVFCLVGVQRSLLSISRTSLTSSSSLTSSYTSATATVTARKQGHYAYYFILDPGRGKILWVGY